MSFRISMQSVSLLSVFLAMLVASPVGMAIEAAAITSAEEVYSRENLLKIEVFMEENAWDKVRLSWRGKERQEVDGKPVTTEFDYEHQTCDILINGVRIHNVGIRKKGFIGSLSSQRPSLKVKFDKYIKGQDFFGLRDLTLNNNQQDTSQIRQYLSYEWFRRAGVPAPRCNLARVYVNGKYLGLYSNVEPIGKPFLKKRFGSAKGNLYESTALDFQRQSVERFEAKTNKKSDDKSKLIELAALLEDVENVEMKELERVVDLDQFLKFWIAEMMLGHWDGYAGNRNNFFVYENPKTELLEFIPWGTDQTFDDNNPFISEETPKIIRAKGRLCAALYANPACRQRYLSMIKEQLKEWWDTPVLLDSVERAVEQVRPHLHVRESDFVESVSDLRAYVENVSHELSLELADPPKKWQVALATDVPADEIPIAGAVKGKFVVQFDHKLAVLDEGFLEVVWRGEPIQYPIAGARAGFKHSNPQWFESFELLLFVTSPKDGRVFWISMSIAPELLGSGKEVKLHKGQVIAWFGTSVANESFELVSGPTIYGRLHGMLQVELLDVDGVKYIKGAIDANMLSKKEELEF